MVIGRVLDASDRRSQQAIEEAQGHHLLGSAVDPLQGGDERYRLGVDTETNHAGLARSSGRRRHGRMCQASQDGRGHGNAE